MKKTSLRAYTIALILALSVAGVTLCSMHNPIDEKTAMQEITTIQEILEHCDKNNRPFRHFIDQLVAWIEGNTATVKEMIQDPTVTNKDHYIATLIATLESVKDSKNIIKVHGALVRYKHLLPPSTAALQKTIIRLVRLN